ncbi:MAG: nucleotide-binding protein [Nitrosopumilaceae archaeon]|nr:nucleotide-binding protein [Nitrosopumilaceae archaeon]
MDFKVLDATAFYAGVPFRSHVNYYTTSLIFDEIKHIQNNYEILQTLVKIKRIIIMDPEQSYCYQTILAAEKTGDIDVLSKEDISAIALCLNLHGELITDDFAIINVSNYLGINTKSIMTTGITHNRKCLYYCPGCNRQSTSKICVICGTKSKKKIILSRGVGQSNQQKNHRIV